MSTHKRFLGQTAVYGISSILARLLNFILTPLYTAAYTKSVYGIFTEMYSYASLIAVLLAFGFETTYFRYLNKQGQDKTQVYSNSFFTVTGIALLFFVISMFFAESISHKIQSNTNIVFKDYLTYVRCFILILTIDAICVIPFARIRADERPLRYGFIKLANIGLFIALNLFFIVYIPYAIKNNYPGHDIFIKYYKKDWIGYVFIANLLANLLTISLLIPEIVKVKIQFKYTLLKQMAIYSWPILIANISFIINENIDKIFIKYLLPASESMASLGVYGACCKIAIFMNIFIQAFRLGAEPFFFSHAEHKNAKQTYASIMHYFVICICIIFVGLIANISILKLFINSSYWSALGVTPVLMIAYIFLGVYMNLSIWYKLSDQTKYALYISVFGAVITIILNVILIPYFNYMAAAWTTLIAYFSMMTISYTTGQKNYPIPYEVKKTGIYIIIACVFALLSFYVFKQNLWTGNFFLMLFLSLIYLREGETIIKLLEKNKK